MVSGVAMRFKGSISTSLLSSSCAEPNAVSPPVQSEVSPPVQLEEEPFLAYSIPPAVRSRDWLDRAVDKLDVAARSWEAVFGVGSGQIRQKLEIAEDLVVLVDRVGVVVGFVSARYPYKMPRTGLIARYIEGTIVHPTRGGKGKFGHLMDAFDVRADLEVLHTQNPHMANSLGRRSAALFPAPDHSCFVGDELAEDLRDLLRTIERAPDFDPLTGVVPGLYGHRLYGTWPFPESAKSLSFRDLNQASAILVVGFKEISTATRLLKSTAQEICR